ncbi:MAG: di-trans,poly-cis-decaprenylcistransferase [Holophagales bacterium]|nr:di-trans,poly-cis-decaprenylcistransferase [Holophagales bacterium]
MRTPHHVAIIMDGNGRWAAGRGLPRIKGHKAGTAVIEEIIDTAVKMGIKHLSLYAFSTENWRRPEPEVSVIMSLLRFYLRLHISRFCNKGVRFHFLCDLEAMPESIQRDVIEVETATAKESEMVFHLAVNYGSRAELVKAVQSCIKDGLKPEAIDESTISSRLWTAGVPDVDLLIRTSGELRISNFLLWQCAYAEFYFADCHWPDFNQNRFRDALEAFASRDRRFGGI